MNKRNSLLISYALIKDKHMDNLVISKQRRMTVLNKDGNIAAIGDLTHAVIKEVDDLSSSVSSEDSTPKSSKPKDMRKQIAKEKQKSNSKSRRLSVIIFYLIVWEKLRLKWRGLGFFFKAN